MNQSALPPAWVSSTWETHHHWPWLLSADPHSPPSPYHSLNPDSSAVPFSQKTAPLSLLNISFLFSLREREHAQAGEGQREREREIPSRLSAFSAEPDMGLELTNREIVTWAEVGRSTDWATQAPLPEVFNTKLLCIKKNPPFTCQKGCVRVQIAPHPCDISYLFIFQPP